MGNQFPSFLISLLHCLRDLTLSLSLHRFPRQEKGLYIFALCSSGADRCWVWGLLLSTHFWSMLLQLEIILRLYSFRSLFDWTRKVDRWLWTKVNLVAVAGRHGADQLVRWGCVSSRCSWWCWRCQEHYELCAGKCCIFHVFDENSERTRVLSLAMSINRRGNLADAYNIPSFCSSHVSKIFGLM